MERSAGSRLPVERLYGLALTLASGGVLGVAAWLTPDPEGHGTHTQLGFTRCGWVALFDKPCPTCGMTTAFGHAAEGQFLQSAVTQPVGSLLSLIAAAMLWGGVHAAISGARVDGLLLRLVNRWTLLGGFALLLAAWGYKLAVWIPS